MPVIPLRQQRMTPHRYCGPIEAAANIQIATCSPNVLIQESIETFGGFHAELVAEPIRWQAGYIIPPAKPGLGIELNETVAAAHPYTGPVFPQMVEKLVWPR
jgi:galactonate dehydratase